jgi:hypothetical protein
MRPDDRFRRQSPAFWANVRSLSQKIGYTDRRTGRIRIPTTAAFRRAYEELGLDPGTVVTGNGTLTPFGSLLAEYFDYRADVLNDVVEPLLMDIDEARTALAKMQAEFSSARPLVMNKQKGDKAGPNPLTNMVNLAVESAIAGRPCDYNPGQLTTVTRDGVPVRTLARRFDGAFPSTVNPVAVWEIKEYYFTTTFGSRVADGVYETMLDGLELAELREHEGIDVRHYLFIDSHRTWWGMGKSYLCRIIDMLHMGHVDEVLFGREVMTRLPELAAEWTRLERPDA